MLLPIGYNVRLKIFKSLFWGYRTHNRLIILHLLFSKCMICKLHFLESGRIEKSLFEKCKYNAALPRKKLYEA
jgi:hypothetical protein